MHHRAILTSIILTGVLAASGACRKSDPAPAVEVQTKTAQQTNMPVTVAGCLKAGEAEGTFVLTTARSEGSAETATYHLSSVPGTNLQDQLGRKVEVTGTMEAQQEIASTAKPLTTDKDARPTGTAGTPTVETKTEIDIKRLSVSSVKPLGDKCDM